MNAHVRRQGLQVLSLLLIPLPCMAQGQGSWGQGYAGDLIGVTLLPLAVSIVLLAIQLAMRAWAVLFVTVIGAATLGGALYASNGVGPLILIFAGPWILMVLLIFATFVAYSSRREPQ